MGRFWLPVIGVLCLSVWASGQSITTEFGKNRIQFHDDFDHWDMYETPNFVVYWYGKGREIAHTVVQMAEMDNPSIQRVLEHKMNDKIEIIVYIDLTDLKQSNLGIEDQFVNQSGITKVVENKVFLYFNGNHNDLQRSLREGIASVYINSMLHGNNLQEIVQNAVLLNLPDWFQEGLVSFVGKDWSPEMESRLKDYFTQPKKFRKDFARLTKTDPQLAGHSMWHFISLTFGKSTISNILYLTRINRSLESALVYVLGKDSRELARQWQAYYEKQFAAESSQEISVNHNLDLVKPKWTIPVGRMRYSPDGQQLAYTLNDHGRVRLMLYDMQTGQKRALFRYGVKNFEQEADLNYPVIAWSPDGHELGVMYERRDVIYHMTINMETGEKFTDKLSPEYHRIYSMDYWSPDTLVLNGTTDGLGDLYLYATVTRESTRITNDFYDDLDASVIYHGTDRYILFSSNRPNESLAKMELDTILPLGTFDLFLLDYDKSGGSLRQLTFTADYSERQARMSGRDELYCLADVNGKWEREHVSQIYDDPPVSDIEAWYDRDIRLHEYVPAAAGGIEVFEKWNKPVIQFNPVHGAVTTTAPHGLEGKVTYYFEPTRDTVSTPPAKEEINPDYLFQTPFPEKPKSNITVLKLEPAEPPVDTPPDFLSPVNKPVSPLQHTQNGSITPFIRSRIIAARLRFKLDYFNVTMDNDVLFGGLDSYAGMKREFEPSPLGLLIKASMKDLLEDYIITGGARFPTTFNGSEYFLVFDNRKRRVDQQFALYRKSIVEPDLEENDPFRKNQYVTLLGQARFSYPFDVYNSLRLTLTLRNDRQIALSTDRPSLEKKTDDAQRIGLGLQWVYDNTRQIDANALLGTRAKFSTELVKRFDLNLFESGKKFQFNKGFMTVLSLDARHYVSPDRRTIFAARFSAATSFGTERILYYLGGVENWLFSSFDNSTSVPPNINFAYTALAVNLRGFKYNARNGSSVVLLNTEVRVPVLQYLSRQKIRSSFLRNIQVVGFLDAGTAWHGKDPFGPDNPLNTVVLTNPPTVKVVVNYYRNPLIVGYGFGARTMLFGYIAKVDYAWSWESETRRKPILYFSIGADF